MQQKTIWTKGGDRTETHDRVERFTVGRDREFDLDLATFDIIGTQAHVAMLNKIGHLSAEEHAAIRQALDDLLVRANAGDLVIEDGVEDIHSQIELYLTRTVGEAGKKIHTGRSRNDQVLLAIKLYLRHELREVAGDVKRVFDELITLADRHRDRLMPGYTHYQIAMPSSFGLWFGAYAESLSEDLELVATALSVVSKNPLGSGAGYGSAFPLDRAFTTEALGLPAMNINSMYAQMTRGKAEKIAAMALSSVAATIGKLANDICLFTGQNFGFIRFPDALTTGSSIMPHKKNPDVFELVRGRCARIQALPNELTLLTNNLMSGYNRDYQLTKEILFPAISSLRACLDILAFGLPQVIVADDVLADPKYAYLFTVEQINEKMMEGMSFRDAYRAVGRAVEDGSYDYRPASLDHTHLGSIGNLGLDEIADRFRHVYETITA